MDLTRACGVECDMNYVTLQFHPGQCRGEAFAFLSGKFHKQRGVKDVVEFARDAIFSFLLTYFPSRVFELWTCQTSSWPLTTRVTF